ncbi:hypothetical protein BC938DRAFT_471324 [Jimgerdemannia flammicorona]|uniref:RING-type domain-containing protein n=1 Tax=Jimgerdemannia flammicorona TaxID=994334 RepID=A0A433QUN1_9FUNG|nr:hypothetical protein BC938DRAFT_471324 [Jimgerdemannia flammicorona]
MVTPRRRMWRLFAALCLIPASRVGAYCCPGATYFFQRRVIYDPAKGNGSFLDNENPAIPMKKYNDWIVNVVPNDSNNALVRVGDDRHEKRKKINIFTLSPLSPLKGILLDFDLSCNATTLPFMTFNLLSLPLPRALTSTPIIALIKHGGLCTWHTKLVNALDTSASLGLTLVGAVIRNNVNQTTPSYSGDDVNTTKYADNDIPDGVSASAKGFVPTIFVLGVYGAILLTDVVQRRDAVAPEGVREFVRLEIVNVQTHLTTEQATVFGFQKGWPWVIIFGGASLENFPPLYVRLISLLSRPPLPLGFILYKWRRIRSNFPAHPPPAPVAILRRGTPLIPAEVLATFRVVRYEPGVCKNSECAICLEELADAQTWKIGDEETVRILPCQHGFCRECVGECVLESLSVFSTRRGIPRTSRRTYSLIFSPSFSADPWLLTETALCPICKFDCLPPELRDPEKSDADVPTELLEAGIPDVDSGPHDVVVQIDGDGVTAQMDDEGTVVAEEASTESAAQELAVGAGNAVEVEAAQSGEFATLSMVPDASTSTSSRT